MVSAGLWTLPDKPIADFDGFQTPAADFRWCQYRATVMKLLLRLCAP